MAISDDRKNIVIIGGGIIGCTSAYFLTRHPSFDPAKHTITLLEASSKVAGGASGKAGGLLGLWAYPTNLVPLSYRLHAELAKEHNGAERWGYRKTAVGQIEARGRPVATKNTDNTPQNPTTERVSLQKRTQEALGLLRKAGVPKDLDWVSPDAVQGFDMMAGPDETAQVHPFQFTTSMASLAQEKGLRIELKARVTSINKSTTSPSDPAVESITYITASSEEKTIPATHVVLAAGPWTSQLLPSSGIAGLRAHSVTIKPTRDLSAYALFTHITLPGTPSPGKSWFKSGSEGGKVVTPEIYARPNSEIYACGEGDTLVPLPSTTDDVVTDPQRCQDIVDYVGSISDELRDGEVTVRQACYLPVCEGSGGPYIGEVKEMRNLVLASGHSCWGIQNGPGTGKLVSEIVMEGSARSVKLGALDPKRALR